MNKYTPFLKFKASEIGALKLLQKNELGNITPFFDLATKKDIKAIDIENTINKGVRKYELNFKGANGFYIDDYDLDDSLNINGDIVYKYLIDKFKLLPYIPVIGIDRSQERINIMKSELIKSNIFALRLTEDDFTSYYLCKDDIEDIVFDLKEKYKNIHLILDCRVCLHCDVNTISQKLIKFINDISVDFEFDKIIITGSSLSATYVEMVTPNNRNDISRKECSIFSNVKSDIRVPVELGDYTIITPDFTEVNIPVTVLSKIMTPKIVYSYDRNQYFLRGGAMSSHPDGAGQYDSLCLELIHSPCFRGEKYSKGDEYIVYKSKKQGKNASPAHMNKHLINAHITYMIKDYK